MSLRRYTRELLDRHAAKRPPGYIAELMAFAVAQDADGVTFDTSRAEYQAMVRRYGPTRSAAAPPARTAAPAVPIPRPCCGAKAKAPSTFAGE